MIKIPDNAEEWDIGLITKLIHEGYDENEILEFKSEINEPTKKIPITACAFANTRGGTIILGVNNDRTNSLSLDQRLIGLVDSDDLKSKITNQLKNIKPDILLSNVQFKESNIRLLSGRVITIVQILKSKNAPHQFEHKFYKRLANGNEPMEVDEIKNSILESAKNETLLNLFKSECGFLRYQLQIIKKNLDENAVYHALQSAKYLDPTATNHFLYHQSHLYPGDFQIQLMRFCEAVGKIIRFRETQEEILLAKPETITSVMKKEGFDTADALVKSFVEPFTNDALSHLDQLETLLDLKFPPPEFPES